MTVHNYMFSFRVIPEEGSLWLEYLIHGQIRFVFQYFKPSFLVRLAFVMRLQADLKTMIVLPFCRSHLWSHQISLKSQMISYKRVWAYWGNP